MSGLEKFQSNDNWRTNFKKLLFMERTHSTNTTEPLKQMDRYSLDIVEDLEMLIDKNKMIANNVPNIATNHESKAKVSLKLNEYGKNNNFAENSKPLDDTFMENRNNMPKVLSLDESFEVIEKMCNKTASDPDSTLFKYLHSENRDEVIAEAKKSDVRNRKYSNFSKLCYDESGNLSSKLQHLHVKDEAQLYDESPIKDIDVTLLEDVEAPSQLWEHTLNIETSEQISPIKMVGHYRPSTILEENNDETQNSNSSSQTSYYTAQKAPECELTTTFQSALYSLGVNNGDSAENPDDTTDKLKLDVLKTKETIEKELYSNNLDLIDFNNSSENVSNTSHLSSINQKLIMDDQEIDFDDTNSIIELYSDEDVPNVEKEINQNYSVNKQDSLKSQTHLRDLNSKANGSNISTMFNDTMEEVEYMLKKGIEYMTAASAINSNDNPSKEKEKVEKENVYAMSSLNNNKKIRTPKKSKQICSPESENQLKVPTVGLDIKPIPKLNLFRHPGQSGIPIIRHKEQISKQFAHVVSPIGAYMKNTAVTPFMSTMKTSNHKDDILNTTAFRELDQDYHLYQPKFGFGAGKKLAGITTGAKSLPKKAYISSEYKQIKDERTPFKIPGGKKIQRYLEPALLPAVVRHDGKMKLPESSVLSSKNKHESKSTPYNNASLADLSVASGDISLYTIMDARKF